MENQDHPLWRIKVTHCGESRSPVVENQDHPLWRIKITRCGESRSRVVVNQEANYENQTVEDNEPSDENHNSLNNCGM